MLLTISLIDSDFGDAKDTLPLLNGFVKENKPKEPIGTSWPVAAFLLVNAALGAGVLNYPYAYDKAGGVFFAAFLQIVRPFESVPF
ncbi:hypothetical protein TNCT_339431 [Trichonephila clavata]|uniref:Uncharacterized protein n=1 Tax=Trichonephila clavata TaxID=2740835 RepID=A0A8X6H4B3_TRICU|nr:hypothetical protein TNCT_339431 [Trichonephila clavata]